MKVAVSDQPPSLLSNRVFARLWATVEVSFLGTFVHVVACGWLMTQMTTSATLVALTQTANALPLVCFSILAGALADTYDKRKTMIAALSISIVSSVLLALAAAFDLLGPWSMLALLFSVGVGVAIFTPSWQASLGGLVERDRLAEAVSLHNMGANVMRTIGPTLGGVLVSVSGAGAAFFVGALSYAPALVTLSFWNQQDDEQSEDRESVMGAMGSGLRFLVASPHIQPILLRVFAFSTSAISIMALLPLVARDQLGGDATAYGILFGAFGLGAILGGLSQRVLRKRHSTETIVRGAIAFNILAIVLMSLTNAFWLGVAASTLGGASWLTVHSLQNTTLQLATPRWMVGRMVSMFLTAAFLGLSVGSWLWGAVAEQFGTQVALGASSLAMALTLGLAWRFPLPETRNMILEPLEGASAPIATVAGRRSGPVLVQIEHVIAPDKRTEFHRLMFLRRRHLTRLGARDWLLAGDMDVDSRWIESFVLPSSGHYDRFMRRRTAETVSLRDDITAVQLDRSQPRTSRLILSTPGPQHNPIMLRA